MEKSGGGPKRAEADAVVALAHRVQRVVTHGEPPERAMRLRRDWDAHVHDLVRDQGPAQARRELLRAAGSHVLHRLRSDDITSLTIGVGLIGVGLGSLSFVFDENALQPPRVQLHAAAGLMLLGLVFVVSPTEPSRRWTGAAGFLLATTVLHALPGFYFVGPLDWLYLPGGFLLLVGSTGLMAWSVAWGPSELRLWSFVLLATAGLLFGIGNVARSIALGADRSFGLLSATSALVMVVVANQVMRARSNLS